MEAYNNTLSRENSSHKVGLREEFDKGEGHIADYYQFGLATQNVT